VAPARRGAIVSPVASPAMAKNARSTTQGKNSVEKISCSAIRRAPWWAASSINRRARAMLSGCEGPHCICTPATIIQTPFQVLWARWSQRRDAGIGSLDLDPLRSDITQRRRIDPFHDRLLVLEL